MIPKTFKITTSTNLLAQNKLKSNQNKIKIMWSLTLQWFQLSLILDQKSLKMFLNMAQYLKKFHQKVLINKDLTMFSAKIMALHFTRITKILTQTIKDLTNLNLNQTIIVGISNRGSFLMILIRSQKIHFNKCMSILLSINSNHLLVKDSINILKFHPMILGFQKMNKPLSQV